MDNTHEQPQQKKRQFIWIAVIAIMMAVGGALYASGNSTMLETSMTMVSHSEYWSGETGQIVAKLYNYKGEPVLADCNATIYTPAKSVFFGPQATDDTLEASDGTHYVNFTTPAEEGVYEYMVECGYTINNKYFTRKISNSFHLNPALNAIRTVNATLGGVAITLDNVSLTVQQILAGQSSNNAILSQINTTTYQVLQNVSGIDANVRDIRDNQFTDSDAFNNFTVTNLKIDQIQANITSALQYCSNPETNSSELCRLVWENNQKILETQAAVDYITNTQLAAINQTTSSIYDYLTTTLAANVNTILLNQENTQTSIAQVNGTVNRIETAVASNFTTVIQNQEEMVYIDVTS